MRMQDQSTEFISDMTNDSCRFGDLGWQLVNTSVFAVFAIKVASMILPTVQSSVLHSTFLKLPLKYDEAELTIFI